MFTGLVQAVGSVVSAGREMDRAELWIDPGDWDHRPEHGESICISGCCLSLVERGATGNLLFHAVPETLAKTTLSGFTAGRRVNLERSLRASDLLGGHLVQGHVDGVGVVEAVGTEGEYRVRVRASEAMREYLVPKGSICMDGVSLTIAALAPEQGIFEVALIPVTLGATTLGELRAGDPVNLETDAIAKTVVHYLRHFAGR